MARDEKERNGKPDIDVHLPIRRSQHMERSSITDTISNNSLAHRSNAVIQDLIAVIS